MSSLSEDVPKTMDLDEEIEGDQIATRDYRFSKIGQPLTIKPNSEFDPQNPPTQPLAVSQIFRLLFVAHPNGFYVARTKEVMEAAQEIRDKGSGVSSIEELSIVDVSIGKVSILALSADDSILAASVGPQLHFFAVSSLLHKEQEPSFSVSVDNSSCIIDMQWAKRVEKAYVVLSHDRKLYQGSGRGLLGKVMDNVDAVGWSMKGDFVAVARKNVLSVFSPQFEEKLSLVLSFKSVIGDSDDDSVIKVNSIRWVRSDCIVIGCLQINGDGEEENYLVQVITSKGGKITDAIYKPVVLSFSGVFLDYWGDAMPLASGPHLFLSYLDDQQLAFVVNRKNQSQHVILLGWPQNDEKNEAVAIEISDDAWIPHIEHQDNDDDNLVLGISIDKVSQNEEVRLMLGEKETEVSPCCVLLCVTIDGKLSLFHFASARSASDLLEASDISQEEEFTSHTVPSLHESSEKFSQVGKERGKLALPTLESDELSRNQLFNREAVKVTMNIDQSSVLSVSKSQGAAENQEEDPLRYTRILIGDEKQKFPLSKLHEDSDIQQTSYTGQQVLNLEFSSLQTSQLVDSGPVGQGFFRKDNSAISGTKSSPGFFSVKDFNDVSGQATSKNLLTGGTEFPKKLASSDSQGTPPLSWPTGAANSVKLSGERSSIFPSSAGRKSEISDRIAINFSGGSIRDTNSSKTSGEKSKPFSSGAVQKSEMSDRSALNISGGPLRYPLDSKEAVSSSLSVNSSGQRAPIGTGSIQPLAAFHDLQLPLQNIASGRSSKSHQSKEICAASSLQGVQNSQPNSSKQYNNIQDMARKLDNLLEGIEGKGGSRDASIASHESLVVALEDGIRALSHGCRIWEGTVDEQLRAIQQLLDKTVQVLARKIYLEGIFKQASDSRYWGLWNRQKLSSELELKRCHIVELNQELTNQLIKLERHFNSLELSRFGENGGLQVRRRTLQSSHEQSRNTQSLHSLHNTMNAQLAAAEQLSECLSKQMAVLNICSPVKVPNIKKELFDTIGLSYDGSSYSSPSKEKVPATPSNKELLTSSCSLATNERSRRNHTSLAKSFEPETARRRRDSLDRTWISFDPPKTTVKRMILQDDHEKMGANRSTIPLDKPNLPLQKGPEVPSSALSTTSSTSLLQTKDKGLPDIPAKESTKISSNALFQWAETVPDPLVPLPTNTLVPPSQYTSLPKSSAGQNVARGTHNLTNEVSKDSKSFIGTIDSMSVGESKSVQYTGTPVHQAPSNSLRFPVQTQPTSKSSIEGSDNCKESAFMKAMTGDMKCTTTIAESLPFSLNESSTVPLSCASDVSPGISIPGKGLDVETSTSQGQPDERMPSSSTLLQFTSSSSSPTVNFTSAHFVSSNSKPSDAKLFSGMSSSSKASRDANQKVPVSQTSVPSVTLSSNFSFPIPKQNGPSSFSPSTSVRSDSLKMVSKDTVSQPFDMPGVKQDQISKTQNSLASFFTKVDDISTAAASVQQPDLPTTVSELKSDASMLATAKTKQATSSKSDNEISSDVVLSSGPDMAASAKPTELHTVEVPSSSVSSGIIGSANNVILDAATHEDEMEEEAPETNQPTELALGSLGFGIGSTPNPPNAKPNPFGVSVGSGTATLTNSPFTIPPPSGELFRPASFSFQPLQNSQPSSQLTSFSAFSAGFSAGNTGQASAVSGFGQPAQIGSGQKALGSVLGAFGQSRQLGAGLPGNGIPSTSGFASGFSGHTSGGFGGGFSGVASTSGGFGSLASVGSGFAGAATAGSGFGGFAAASTAGGGFAAAATAAAAFSGGFGAFGNQQGGGGFPTFGSTSGTGRPASELFTQMRK